MIARSGFGVDRKSGYDDDEPRRPLPRPTDEGEVGCFVMQMNSIEDSDSFSLFTEISPSRTERDRIYLDTMTRKISPLALLGAEEVFVGDARAPRFP